MESNRKHIDKWIERNKEVVERCNKMILEFMLEKEFAEKNIELLEKFKNNRNLSPLVAREE
jgi:hypothetical protein